MSSFASFVDSAGAVVLDGGLASELERRGADLRDPLWSARMLVEDPELIRRVHESYFLAGADVGTSGTYQASFLGFARRGLSPKNARDLMRLGVRLVREAGERVGGRRFAAASIGCYGATLGGGAEYVGVYDLDADELRDWHRPRLETFLEEDPDVLACETIPCLAEAEALARLLEEYPRTPAWLSFCCRDGERLASGEPFAEAVRIAANVASVVAVGFNCVAPEFADTLIAAARPCGKPVVAYPNAGGEWDASAMAWRLPRVDVDWGEAGRRWRSAGATLIGGCCRTTPDDIRRLRRSL